MTASSPRTTVRPRLAWALLRATEKAPDKPVPINFTSLSLGLGIRDATLQYHLNQLRDAGIIRTRTLLGVGTELTVLNREVLERLAYGEVKEVPGAGDGVAPTQSTDSSDQDAVAHDPPQKARAAR